MSDGEDDPAAEDGLRARAEAELKQAVEGTARAPDSPEDPPRLLHELRVHQIELEMQNEELRRAQTDLESSRARYFELFDLAPVGYCTVSDEGLILEANLTAAKLLGATRSELGREPFSAFIDPTDQDTFYRRRKLLIETASPQGFELRLKRKEAGSFWAWLEVTSSRRADGEPALHVAINDITALKQAERELRTAADAMEQRIVERTTDLLRTQEGLRNEIARRRESEERLLRSQGQLRAILEAAAEAIVTADLEGNIELFNVAAERMFGWKANEVLGKKVNLLMPPPDSAQHDEYIGRYLRTGERRVIGIGREVVGLRKDGTTFPLDLSVSDVVADGSRKFTGILRDLTERHRLEEQFRQAQKMEAVARLASGIAHDFNNLLMGILACCKAARGELPEEHGAATHLDEIKGAAERGAALTRQLLSFSRRQSSQRLPLRLNQIVSSVAGMLNNVLGEDIELELELCASGGPILGDASSLEQVLMNLVVNARDAMKAGGSLRIATRESEFAQVRHTRSRVLPAGRYVELVVEDSGCGITPDVQDRIFEPFFTTKPVGEGTGLGLFSVFGIVERLGGAVEFETELGRGTKFTILLPRDESGAESVPSSGPRPSDIVPAPVPGARKTILVVEDERLIRSALKRMLGSDDFDVLMAESVDEARRVATEHAGTIELLLTDIVLPGGSGGALAEWLQRTRPELRVVFISAYPNEVLIQQGRIPAGTPSLEKPFDEAQLKQALRRAMESAPSAS